MHDKSFVGYEGNEVIGVDGFVRVREILGFKKPCVLSVGSDSLSLEGKLSISTIRGTLIIATHGERSIKAKKNFIVHRRFLIYQPQLNCMDG